MQRLIVRPETHLSFKLQLSFPILDQRPGRGGPRMPRHRSGRCHSTSAQTRLQHPSRPRGPAPQSSMRTSLTLPCLMPMGRRQCTPQCRTTSDVGSLPVHRLLLAHHSTTTRPRLTSIHHADARAHQSNACRRFMHGFARKPHPR